MLFRSPLAVHLFILYWGMLSFITPPVALGAFSAASIAQASPIATGFEAMRLGVAIYLVPFLFALNPSLIGNAPAGQVAVDLAQTALGVALVAYATQRVMPGLGVVSHLSAGVVFAAGLCIMMPQAVWLRLGLDLMQALTISGCLLAGVCVVEWAKGHAAARAR